MNRLKKNRVILCLVICSTLSGFNWALGQVETFTTADGWEWINPIPFGGNFHTVYLLNNQTAVVGGSYGVIIRTADCGDHWTQSKVPEDFIADVTRVVFIAHQVYGYAAGGGRLLESDDGGESWEFAWRLNDYYVQDVTTAGESVIVLVRELGSQNSVRVKNYREAQWRLLFEPSEDFRSLQRGHYPFFWNENRIFRLGESVVSGAVGIRDVIPVPRSNNFIFLRDSTICLNVADDTLVSFDRDLAGLWAVDENTFYAVGENIFRSRDGGRSWVDLGHLSVRLESLSFSGSQVGFAVGQDSRIIYTINAGNFWSNSMMSESLFEGARCVYFRDDSVGYLQTSDYDPALTFKTEDRGESWRLVATADRAFIHADKFQYLSNERFFFIIDGQRRLWRMYNSPQSSAYCLHFNVSDFFFLDDAFGWFITRNELFYTYDGGIFWNTLHEFPDDSLNTLFFVSRNVGYIGGDRGRVLKTTDGGNNWVDISVAGVDVNGLWFIGENYGFAAADEGTFFITTNGGRNWRPKNTGTQDDLYIVKFFNERVGYVVSSGGFITTRDGGDNFLTYIAPLDFEVGHTQRTPSLNVLDSTFSRFIYARGRNMLRGVNYILDAPGETEPPFPRQACLLPAYPNPFNSGTKLSFSVPQAGLVQVAIYDLRGREVDLLLNRALTPGVYTLNWRPGSIPSGVYLCALQAGGFQETRSVVMLK